MSNLVLASIGSQQVACNEILVQEPLRFKVNRQGAEEIGGFYCNDIKMSEKKLKIFLLRGLLSKRVDIFNADFADNVWHELIFLTENEKLGNIFIPTKYEKVETPDGERLSGNAIIDCIAKLLKSASVVLPKDTKAAIDSITPDQEDRFFWNKDQVSEEYVHFYPYYIELSLEEIKEGKKGKGAGKKYRNLTATFADKISDEKFARYFAFLQKNDLSDLFTLPKEIERFKELNK